MATHQEFLAAADRWRHQERASATIARALARQPSKICVPRPFEDESMHVCFVLTRRDCRC